MAPPTRPASMFSKVSVKSQTVISREVRERLELNRAWCAIAWPRRRAARQAQVSEADDPFATFSEWGERGRRKGLWRICDFASRRHGRA